MAGGSFFGRVFGYVVNELVVEGLANNRTFQRFAVRTAKTLESMTSKAAEAKQQLKDVSKSIDSFRRQ